MIDLPARALDLTGQRFGDLTALRPVDKRRGSIVWECSCECGGRALRKAQDLRRSLVDGSVPCCQVCLEELRGGLCEEHRQRTGRWAERRKETLRALWDEHRTLYSLSAVDWMVHDVAEQLWRDSLIVPDDPLELELRRQIEQYGSICPGLGWSPNEPRHRCVPYEDDDALPGTEQGKYAQLDQYAEEPSDPLDGAEERHAQWEREKVVRARRRASAHALLVGRAVSLLDDGRSSL